MTDKTSTNTHPMTPEKCRELGVMYGKQGINREPIGWHSWSQAQKDAFERGRLAGMGGSDNG